MPLSALVGLAPCHVDALDGEGSLPILLRTSLAAEPADQPSDPPPPSVVGLTVYTGDSLAFGYVPLTAARVMVPLTEATIEWETPDGRKIARLGTLVVNRLRADWIARHA